jgi:nitric oxide synthase oxygenase domain/subunit
MLVSLRYSDSDVVRELTDVDRYNLCKPIAEAMGLDTRSNSTLWKDKAMQLVNEAVMSSYQSVSWKLVDHHTLLADFFEWYKKEKARRGYCPGAMPSLATALASSPPRPWCANALSHQSTAGALPTQSALVS